MSLFRYGVVIGRFQPFHNGHELVVREALKRFDRVLVILGSAQEELTLKNPFGVYARRKMVLSCFPEEQHTRMKVAWVIDRPEDLGGDEAWIRSVKDLVHDLPGNPTDEEVTIFGYEKDASSYYLRSFPWKYESYDGPILKDDWGQPLGATWVRKLYLNGDESFVSFVPGPVAELMLDWMKTKEYVQLVGMKTIDDRQKNAERKRITRLVSRA